jgi:hypothetical protein
VTTIDLPDGQFVPLQLLRDQRVTLGGTHGDVPEELDRISLGRPVVRPLNLTTVDEGTRSYITDRPGARFLMLALTCSFRADVEEPLEKAWIEAAMRIITPDYATEPIAWSLEPQMLTDEVTVSRTVRLDGMLKLTSEVVPIQAGPGASRETKTEFRRQQPYVEAYREGTARPAWIFTRTAIAEIRGIHRMRAVVELPSTAVGEATVGVGATVRYRVAGPITYRARLDHLPVPQRIQL